MGGTRQGFSLLEVMIASFLLSFAAIAYISAMTQGVTLSGMTDQHLDGMHIARDVMEQVKSQKYENIHSISPITENGYTYQCNVANSSFANTKDITVTVTYKDVGGETLTTIELQSSATLYLHK